MSSKINRLRAERGKNDEKIAVLRARNNEIDKQITELENLDIVGIVRSMHDAGTAGRFHPGVQNRCVCPDRKGGRFP